MAPARLLSLVPASVSFTALLASDGSSAVTSYSVQRPTQSPSCACANTLSCQRAFSAHFLLRISSSSSSSSRFISYSSIWKADLAGPESVSSRIRLGDAASNHSSQ